MNVFKKLMLSVALLVAVAAPAAASVTQTTPPAGWDSWGGWNSVVLGSVTFANNTDIILGLSSVANLADQGWGGQDPSINQIYIALFDNEANVWGIHVAGAIHGWRTESFNIADVSGALAALNVAMDNFDWSSGHTLQMRMIANSVGWPGWELHINNASFSVTSEVPEPGSLALLGLGLFGFMVSRRKFSK